MKLKLRELLAEKGWSLYRLAKEINYAPQTVYHWGVDRSMPSWRTLDQLCQVLECKISDLLEPEPVQTKMIFKREG